MVFVIVPIASAQLYPDILNNQWFKIKLGLKGYKIITPDTVLGKGAGSITSYLYFSYNDNPDPAPDTYTITTCTQDDLNPTEYHARVITDAFSIDNVYGEIYPQVWDFGGTPLVFDNGSAQFEAYPTFYTKITATDGTLKNASISNVFCGLFATLLDDDQGANRAVGSCSISGPLILPANVAKKVPPTCRP